MSMDDLLSEPANDVNRISSFMDMMESSSQEIITGMT